MKILLPIIIFAVLILGYFYINTNFNIEPNYSDQNTKQESKLDQENIFASKLLKFSFTIPSGYRVEDKSPVIEINSDKGAVTLSRNGTNFNSIEDYLEDYDSKRNIIIRNKEDLKINNYQWVVRNIEFPKEKTILKSYYYFINNSVYIISTDKSELYSVLDQIAQSFRYIP